MAKTREVRIPKIPIREEVLPVYKANVSKLGLLPSPLPANLALLFTLAAGIREDFKTLCESAEKVDVDEMMRFQGGVLLLLRCTMWLMEETKLRLRRFLGERLSSDDKKKLKEAIKQKKIYLIQFDQAEQEMRERRKVAVANERRGS
jgi:hypothetical protein